MKKFFSLVFLIVFCFNGQVFASNEHKEKESREVQSKKEYVVVFKEKEFKDEIL